MKLTAILDSWLGKALIAAALFGAGYYFPLFNPPGTSTAPAAAAASSPPGASAVH